MACKAAVAVVPFHGHVLRLDRCDRAKVGGIAVETNASTGFEFAGFVGGHCSWSSGNQSLSVRIRSVVGLEDAMVWTDHFRHELLAQLGRAFTLGRIDVRVNWKNGWRLV